MAEGSIMRDVVGEEQKPYDRNSRGDILYVWFDVLECGHKIKRFNPRPSSRTAPKPPSGPRRCKKCEEIADAGA